MARLDIIARASIDLGQFLLRVKLGAFVPLEMGCLLFGWNLSLYLFENSKPEFLTIDLLAFANQVIIVFSLLYALTWINSGEIPTSFKLLPVFEPDFALIFVFETISISAFNHLENSAQQLFLEDQIECSFSHQGWILVDFQEFKFEVIGDEDIKSQELKARVRVSIPFGKSKCILEGRQY